MTGGKFHRFKEKVKNKMERATISSELQGFTAEEIQPLLPVPKLFSLGRLNIYIYRQVSTSRGGHSGGAGGAQATPGILIFQKQVTPCHQIR